MSHSQASDPAGLTVRFDSLPSALAFVAREAGYEVNRDDLSAALGLSVMPCASEENACLKWWAAVAHDAFLVEVGHVFGMTMRGLHPPAAARGLENSPEYDQHFEASYRPLIARALENHQAVLGWCTPSGMSAEPPTWLLIRGTRQEGVGLTALMFGTGEPGTEPIEVSLDRPPIQVYLVERITPAHPSSKEQVDLMLDHTRRVLNDEIGRDFAVSSGPCVFDAWINRLRSSATCEGCKEPVHQCHRRLACMLIEARRSAIRFLDRHAAGAADADGDVIRTLRRAFTQMIDDLSESVNCIRAESPSPTSPQEAIRHVADARAATMIALTTLLSRNHQSQDRAS